MKPTSRQREDANRTKKKMSKEQLRLALIKKRECDAGALAIVERLIENEVDQKWLVENLERINRCHMEDVVEERAILKRCGYPLCDNPLKVNINQRYHISTRSNKVYDVSRRKNFCSNNCYGAGNYISEQMLTSPLWLRDPKEKVEFQLLPVTVLSKNSTPGDVVDLGVENIILDSNTIPENTETQSSDESPAAKVRVDDKEAEKLEERIMVERILKAPDPEESNAKSDIGVAVDKIDKDNSLAIERDVRLETSSVSELPPKRKKAGQRRGKIEPKQDEFDPNRLVERIERYLREWITLDSLVLLSGDTALKRRKVKEMTEGSGSGEIQKKYIQLCRKVNLLQIDKNSEEEETKTDLRPLPDYGVLKEEGKKMKIQVQAFFEGRTAIETPATPSDDSRTKETEDSSTFVPTLCEREPKTVRRRIVLEKLDKVLPEMLRTLAGGEFIVQGCIGSNGCGRTVKALVNTFSLSASNVIPKPAEWNLLGLVFIKLLSISEPRLRFLLGTERATKYITMILMSYNLEPNYLETLVAVATDVASYRSTGLPNIDSSDLC